MSKSPWLPLPRVPRHLLPGDLAAWLLDNGSLTARLRAACSAGLRVQVLGQGRELPTLDERRMLGMRGGRRALVREVRLLCGGRPWVYARTVMPLSGLGGSRRRLARLGDRPLGAVLYSYRGMRRDCPEIARLNPGHALFARALGDREDVQALWGRRSVFRLGRASLLVYELFLPELGGD
jgi:chorismate--pyruvate lyase